MTGAQAIIVYCICWWLCLFMALPVGVRPQRELLPGAEPAAPEKTWLGVKCLAVTLLAGLFTWAIDFVVESGIVAVK